MTKNISVMGIYSDRATVSDAVNVLSKVGYRPADISVLWAENQGTKDFALEKRTKALEGAAGNAMLAVQATNAVRALFVSAKLL